MAELRRSLGYFAIISLAVASIMGTGLFYGAGIAPQYAGNASILSWVVLSLFGLYIAACFGELTSMFPEAGGVYEFCKRAYGRFFSFIIGWVAWLVGNITTSLIVVAAVNLIMPSHPGTIIWKFFIAVGIIILLNYIAFLGSEASAATLVMLATVSFVVILAFLIPGFGHIDPANFQPFFEFGTGAIFVAVFFIAESFFGWESATFLSEETNNPEKVIPKSLIIGTLITAVAVILVNIVSLGAVPWRELAGADVPFLYVAGQIFNPLTAKLLAIGVFVTMINSAFGGAVTMPRLILALARDRLFLSQFSKIHKTRATPYKAIIFQTIVSLLILYMGFGSYFLLLSLLLPLGFIMYAFVLLAVPILRKKMPGMKRPFNAPFPIIGPIISVMFILYLVVKWIAYEPNAWSVLSLGVSLVFFGFPLYFLISLYYDPEMITEANDIVAYFTLFTERISLPGKVKKEILAILGSLKGKTVLEYGCSVGTLTLDLARAVGPDGRLYAVDLSRNDLKITQKRIEKLVWSSKERIHGRVTIIHDDQQVYRLHSGVSYSDVIVSVGMLGYIQDIEKMLREFYSILPPDGKICFVEYGDFFKLIPNVEWLSKNEVVSEVFRRAGFSVQVERKKGLFWNYIYVYGIKSHEAITLV
ncbi:amino acid permease [Candidatus Woesearchaeota archaeon]|nr:amino acid permease [Candidatus Woesearchaeota archaeon]